MNKAEAVAWANYFLQKEQLNTEQFSLIQGSGAKTEGKSPGSEITVCVGHAFGKSDNILTADPVWCGGH